MARRLTALLVTTTVMVMIASMATASGATVFYTACDALSVTDTVKLYKIEQDGTGKQAVADTTIPHCDPMSSRQITGLAIAGDYAYFSWNGTGGPAIGRVGLNGTGLNLNQIAAPVGANDIRLNANVADGRLYLYAADGGYDLVTNPRIMRVSTAGGSYETVFAPSSPNRLSFGIGGNYVYYATQPASGFVTSLGRMGLSGSGADNSWYPGTSNPLSLLVGASAALVASSNSTLFLYTSGGSTFGISTLGTSGSPSSYVQNGAVPASSAWVNNAVWNGTYLFYTIAPTGTNTAIGRVAENGTGRISDFVTAAMVHQIAIGTMPTPSTTPAPGPSVTPPKPTLKLSTIKNFQNILITGNLPPETSVDCTTSNSQTLSSCQVEILANASLLKTGRAGTGKTVLVGNGTATSTTGSATLKVKVRITNKQARAILKKGGRLKATIRVTATTTASQTSTASKGTTLVGAKKKAKALYRR